MSVCVCVHMYLIAIACVWTCVICIAGCYTNIFAIGIFEKPTAEEQAAAKSRRLNLLEVYILLSL